MRSHIAVILQVLLKPSIIHSVRIFASYFAGLDRLGVAAFGASLIHVIVILGVSFSMPRSVEDRVSNLEITLVQTSTDKAPRDAQFLAQANQDGGGQSESADVAQSPLPISELSENNNQFPLLRRPPQTQVVTMRSVDTFMTRDKAQRKIHLAKLEPEPKEAQFEPENLGLIDDDVDLERARLSAEISRSWQEYQKRPKRKFLNARTAEYKYALYLDAWRAKVESVGNLNYPDEAKRRHIAGNLMLDVSIKSDGSVNKVRILRSSGKKVLDDAAIRIVELAAPFDPFPANIRREADIVHITRTWKFNEGNLETQAQ